MKKIFISLVFILTNIVFAQKESFITLKTKTGEIHGSLINPPILEKTPVVLIISGSGPTDRNGNNPMMTNNSLKMLAEGLANKGIASVRYDKRGVGKSKNTAPKESDLRFENYIQDAIDWVNLLKEDKRFSEIIILGHSEGSLIGMIASQEKPVKAFISIAGAGSPAGELITEQLKMQPAIVKNQSLPIIKKLEQGETVTNVPQMLYSLFRPSVQPYMISWFKYNPQEEIAKLKKPVLIIQGSTDIQVNISDSEKLQQAIKTSEIKIIPKMNHILKESEMDRQTNIQTYSNPTLPIKQELIPTIVSFLKK